MEFMVYLLKVNIALALFYGIYRLLFRQDTFFQWKRRVLLTILFISFAYPMVDLSRQLIGNHPEGNLLETVYIPINSLPEVVVTGNATHSVLFFQQALPSIYFLIAGLLFIRMLFQIGTILYKLSRTTKKVLYGRTVYESPGLKTPFSFFRWIVLDSSQYSEPELQEILMHETTHGSQIHSADTILAELVCIVCWFNPFAWLLKSEVRMNLEFLADRSVLSSGCRADHYQFHLLRLSYHKAAAKITNNFNVSLLKKRIFMMNKKQTSRRSIWKYASILPAVALLLFFNSAFQTKASPDNEMTISQQASRKAQDQPAVTTASHVQQAPQKAKVKPAVVKTSTAQQTPQKVQEKTALKENKVIFSHVEVMPQFPGGDEALIKYLHDNVNYPKEAAEQGIQGRVTVRFVVTPSGAIEDVSIQKELDPVCDEEAIRVVKAMPNWIPGKQNGKTVTVYYSLPIVFKLSNGKTKPTSVAPNNQNFVIEVDGKEVPQREFQKLDLNSIESLTVNKDVQPNRLIIKTKKVN